MKRLILLIGVVAALAAWMLVPATASAVDRCQTTGFGFTCVSAGGSQDGGHADAYGKNHEGTYEGGGAGAQGGGFGNRGDWNGFHGKS